MRISEGLAKAKEMFKYSTEYQKAVESLYARMSEKATTTPFEDKHYKAKRLGQLLTGPGGYEVDIACSTGISDENGMRGESVYALSLLGQTVELVAVSKYRYHRKTKPVYTMQFRLLLLENLGNRKGVIDEFREVVGLKEIKKANEWVESWREGWQGEDKS